MKPTLVTIRLSVAFDYFVEHEKTTHGRTSRSAFIEP